MPVKMPIFGRALTARPRKGDNGRMRLPIALLVPAILGFALLVVPLAAAAPAQSAKSDAAPASGGAPQRVIVEVGRFETAMGTLESEDEEVIVIRTTKGKIESFSKGRIIRVVRLTDPEPGQKGVVILRNGQLRDGVIIEDTFEHVLIEIEGIRARLMRETVDRVVLQPTFEETYRRFKAALTPGNSTQHYELCRWLFDERKYDLCKTELDALLEEGEMVEARRLMRLVDAQLALIKPKIEGEEPADGEAEPEAETSEEEITGNLALRPDILTHADVNIMRVYEIDFDHPPRVQVDPATIEKLIATYSDNKLIPASRSERNALFNAEPLDLVEHLFFALQARELYPEIKVITEPQSLNLFRIQVHNTWLMNNCASTDCHGNTFGGRLMLHRTGYRDARVRYTNLLILDRLNLDNPDLPPMIDYEQPMNSLLIQYGLPREEARFAHPDVPNWTPAFAPGLRKGVDSTVEWIKAMMYPRPMYPVQFEPPQPKIEPAFLPEGAEEPSRSPDDGDEEDEEERQGKVPR